MKHTIFKHTASQSHRFPPEGHPNLTSGELDTLHNLSTKQDIVIKPADKGGAIVIMDTHSYVQAGTSMLSNPNHYGNPTTCDLMVKDETDFIINTLHRLHVIPEQTTRFCIE